MAAQEVLHHMSRSRLTPVPRQSQDFDTKHVASLGAERTEISLRRRLMAGASWLEVGPRLKMVRKPHPTLENHAQTLIQCRSYSYGAYTTNQF